MISASTRRRRQAAGLALSLAVHGALLLAFMSVAPRLVTLPRLPSPPERSVELELRRAAAAGATSASTAPRRPHSEAAKPAPTLRSPLVHDIAPRSPAAPSAAAPPAATAVAPAPSAGQDDGRWRVQGGGDAGAAARALARGTVGCGAAEYLHLTADERDHCYAEIVRGMRTLTPDAIPPAKRAYYDQVVAAYAKMHAPTPFSHANLGDNLGLKEQWEGPPGAHPPGIGCKFAFGKPRGWKTYANRANPPHALKLGRLPCFLSPPSGLDTEEADVEPPASLREQEDDAAHAARFAPLGKPPG